MVSIEDVARRAGVSPITASRVVRNQTNVAPATRERVLRAAAELNYIPNAVARGLRQARSGLLALIITDITSPFFADVARGAEDAAREAGVKLILGNSYDDPAFEADYLRSFGEHRVDGIVLVPTDHAGKTLRDGLPKKMPIVLLDRGVEGAAVDLVRCDTSAGTQTLCRHLLDLGHQRIAMVGGVASYPTWHERVSGYAAALSNAGLPLDQDLIVAGDYKADGGVAATRQLMALPAPPDAIVAANAQTVLGVLDELVRLRCRVPEDISVAAIDDPLPPSTFWARLTVIAQPGYEMGRAAIDLLFARLGDGSDRPVQELVFAANLLVGVSCGEGIGKRVI
jgi:LacI family transcriptional regulator